MISGQFFIMWDVPGFHPACHIVLFSVGNSLHLFPVNPWSGYSSLIELQFGCKIFCCIKLS